MSTSSETIILLDNDESLLAALERMFISLGFTVKSYTSAEAFFAAGSPPCPACLLLDLKVGKIKGMDVQAQVRGLGWELPIIFLTSYGDLASAVRAMRAGAEDFLLKPCNPEELLGAVMRALESSRGISRFGNELIELRRRASLLTRREREIIALVVAGMLNKQIAEHLNLALITVKVHRGNAMRKLGARNPAELTRIARVTGICEMEFSAPPLNYSSRSDHKRF
jgi:FixJ family two-component response regulator